MLIAKLYKPLTYQTRHQLITKTSVWKSKYYYPIYKESFCITLQKLRKATDFSMFYKLNNNYNGFIFFIKRKKKQIWLLMYYLQKT